jgi:hypothetical protein
LKKHDYYFSLFVVLLVSSILFLLIPGNIDHKFIIFIIIFSSAYLMLIPASILEKKAEKQEHIDKCKCTCGNCCKFEVKKK